MIIVSQTLTNATNSDLLFKYRVVRGKAYPWWQFRKIKPAWLWYLLILGNPSLVLFLILCMCIFRKKKKTEEGVEGAGEVEVAKKGT